MLLREFVIEGLGHISALIADDDRRLAAVIDPRRDVDVYLAEAAAQGLRITHVVETHLHNDYVSGARELAAVTGAQHIIGAAAELRHDHRPVAHRDRFSVGALEFRVLETPGHTPEHVAYAVSDRSRADEPLLLFTGGSLLVGAVGRTDLLGAENAVPFARQLFASLHDVLLSHEDFVGVHPTHGGGSLCSKDISSTTSTTIGFERRHNPMLAVDEVETFARTLLDGQPPYPRYFNRMRPINQAGPAPLGAVPAPAALPMDDVRARVSADHLLLDLRSPAEHAVAHVPGSVSIPAGSSFGTWLGWIVPPDRPLLLLLDSPADWDGAVRQALRIGYEGIDGYVHGGFERWQSAGGELEANGRLTVRELRDLVANGGGANGRGAAPLVLDVRQHDEYARSHVPGAVNVHAGELPERLAELPRDRPIATICASGYRSSIAASLLRTAGFEQVSWVSGGVPSWRAAGYDVESGDGEVPVAATSQGAGA